MTRAVPVDLFPQTNLTELVVLLERDISQHEPINNNNDNKDNNNDNDNNNNDDNNDNNKDNNDNDNENNFEKEQPGSAPAEGEEGAGESIQD